METKQTRVANVAGRLQDLVNRAGTLGDRCQAAAEYRQSLELSKASTAYNEVWGQAFAALNEVHEQMPDDALAETERLTAELTTKLDGQALPRVIGLGKDDKAVTHFCVTASKAYGYGVYSAHDNKEDAQHNAALTGGKCAAVSRHEETRAIIKPLAVIEAERLYAEHC